MKTTAWLDSQGSVLREDGPIGFTTIRETQEAAVHDGWPDSDGLDLARQVAIPANRDIADPRASRYLKVRLSGIGLEHLPSDAEQRSVDGVLTISRSMTGVANFHLPYSSHDGVELSEFLRATPLMQVEDPRLQKAAAAAIHGASDALEGSRRINQWVFEHLRKVPTVSLPNALEILDHGEGDCNEHATLFTAMARAAGVPTRMVAGVVYLNRAFLYHAWAEVWLGRWVSVDPTLNQMPVDATHIKLVEGDVDAQMSLMDIIGKLQIEVIADQPLS